MLLQKHVIDFVYRPSIGDLKLVIAFVFDIIHMTSDSGADSGRDFGGCNLYQIVTHAGAFPCGYGDSSKWQEEPISTDHLQKLGFVDIHGIDSVVIDDRTEPWTGEGNFCMRVFTLQEVSMISGCEGILAEVIQSQKCGESYAAHASFQSPFLGIQAIGKDAFVTRQMQRFVFIRVIGFLEDGDIIGAACVKLGILISVHRVDFQTNDLKVFPCDFAGFTNVANV